MPKGVAQPSPRIIYPIWLILEYASILLKSVWPIAAKAARTMEIVATSKNTCWIGPLKPNTEIVSLIKVYTPTVLVTMPASNTDTGAGADE